MEEEDTDQLLTYIAKSYINIEAEDEGNYSWKKGEEEEDAESEKSISLATYTMWIGLDQN